MGVKGLLQCLQDAVQVGSVSDFKGTRVAIDASGWLHKGLYSAAEDFVDSGFNDSQFYVDFILTRARILREAGVEPVLVFDGKRNNLKSETQAKREEIRASNIEQGRRLMDSMQATGDSACRQKLRLEAISSFQKGLGVTHEMEINTISALRKLGIETIVAPYEADAQLAHLCQIGYCDSVLTEDGDILVYSAISGVPFNVFYKFDRGGSVQVINLGEMQLIGPHSTSDTDTSDAVDPDTIFAKNSKNKEKDKEKDKEEKGFIPGLKQFRGPSGRRMFAQMCLLAGCDYSESVHGVGLIAAQKAVLRYKSCTDDERLEKICSHFRSTGKKVPDEYLARALRAEILFHYHPVYNPTTKTVEPFMPHSAATVYDRKSRISCGQRRNPHSKSAPVDCNDGWRGPAISDCELTKLGSEAELLRNAPAGVTIADICEGKCSYKTFQPILLSFPWENPKLPRPSGRASGGSHWGTRRGLMQATAALSQGGRISAPGGRVQQLPSSSWNRGPSNVQFARHQPYSQPIKQPSRLTPSISLTSHSSTERNTAGGGAFILSGTAASTSRGHPSQHMNWSNSKDRKSGGSSSSGGASMLAESFSLPKRTLPSSYTSSGGRVGGGGSGGEDNEVEVLTPRIPPQSCPNSAPSPSTSPSSSSSLASNSGSSALRRTPQNRPGETTPSKVTPNSPGVDFDFYGSQETDREDSVQDLSWSPEKSSNSSDDGMDTDSPISCEEGRGGQMAGSMVCRIGGIAGGQGQGPGKAIAAEMEARESSIIAQCVGFAKAATPRLPPAQFTVSLTLPPPHRGDGPGPSLLYTCTPDIAPPEGDRSRDTRESDPMILDFDSSLSEHRNPLCGVSSGLVDTSQCVSSSGRMSVPSGKENFNTAADSNIDIDLSMSHEEDVKASHCDSRVHSVVALKGASSAPSSSTVQGVKRKLYDTVAIVLDTGRGGRGKKVKSSMRVASIMSFFTPR